MDAYPGDPVCLGRWIDERDPVWFIPKMVCRDTKGMNSKGRTCEFGIFVSGTPDEMPEDAVLITKEVRR